MEALPLDAMSDSTASPSGAAPDRRELLRRLGLTAAGLTLGPYVAPAIASFKPPAALVGSETITFWEEHQRNHACDGPAATMPGGAMYSINSSGFEGEVTFTVLPTTATQGWLISMSPGSFTVLPGDSLYSHLTIDCYNHPMVGAVPMLVKVRILARAFPADGSPSFLAGVHEMWAECVPSTLAFGKVKSTAYANKDGIADAIEMLEAGWVDSGTFGTVKLSVSEVPPGWFVSIMEPEVGFTGSDGSHPVHIRTRVPKGKLKGPDTYKVHATLDHPSFAAPMTAMFELTIKNEP